MKVYVLVTEENVVSGIYSSRDKLIAELTTTWAATAINKIEIWDVDNGFVDYLTVNRQTTITIQN